MARSLTVAALKAVGLIRSQCRVADLFGFLHEFDVEAERLQLADEDVERFGHAGFSGGLALHNRLVDFGAAIDVIRLGREKFLQNVGGAISFERPDFYFTEALAVELRVAT